MTNYRRRHKPIKTQTVRLEINHRIRDFELRVIDEKGENLGILKLTEALKIASERELDLVKINPKAIPAIAKIIDYRKFKYQQSKSENFKKNKEKKVKTIRVSVNIAPHDLAVQGNKCDEFLRKGHQVKLQVQMKGREKMHPEVAKEVMESFMALIKEPFDFIAEPKRLGDSYFASIKPKNNPVSQTSNSSNTTNHENKFEDKKVENTQT
jgi:translation initiation factor IF-3